MHARYCEKKECAGCGACAAACVNTAINMAVDEEGFLYPKRVEDRCIDCGVCNKLCVFQQAQSDRQEEDEPIDENRIIYIGRNIDEKIVSESRSGGIFTALSDDVMKRGGKVYGCVLDENLEATHICARDKADRGRMRGSKYVQSILPAYLYREIKDDTNQGIFVLFSGTPCQVDAVKQFGGIDKAYLLTMDIVCHGVVSPKIWKLYRQYMEIKYEGKCVDVDFRNKKKYGWKEHIETMYLRKNDRKVIEVDQSIYRDVFYEHYALRPSCYACPYKSQLHPSDITVGDCWGIEAIQQGYNDDKGCSIILTNTDKGEEYLQAIRKDLDIKKMRMRKELFQPGFHVSFQVDKHKREAFWEEVENREYRIFETYENRREGN